MIRPLRADDDLDTLVDVQNAAFTDLDVRLGLPVEELTDEARRRAAGRVAHLQRTDPERAFVAEVDGALVGLALALLRDGMWFLSLLVVAPEHHGRGVGRALLDAALATSTDRSWILATQEPAALRRYQRAGFALHPSYTAKGTLDRGLLPAVNGVRDGSWDRDLERADEVVRRLRGARMTPDLGYLATRPGRLLVSDEGFAVLAPKGVALLGATSEAIARSLLWAALAEAAGPVEVDWLAANQQWAIDVCLDARLSLHGGASLALRGQPTMAPYLPSGAFG